MNISHRATSSQRQATTAIPKPTRNLLQPTGEAIRDFDLIRDGDRVLVGLSGGKDSMGLLQTLITLRQRAPISFAIGTATVDPQMPGYDPAPLAQWTAALDIEHHPVSYSLGRYAHGSLNGTSLCSFCSRMRRGKLYGIAREQGYNVIALGHHLDDAAETFLMNSFFGGKLRTMRAAYTIDDGDLRVIRPLIYVRERHLQANAQISNLPLIEDNCPSCDRKPTQRNAMKQLLNELEQQHSTLFASLKTSLRPLLSDASNDEEAPWSQNSASDQPIDRSREQPIQFMPDPIPAANAIS